MTIESSPSSEEIAAATEWMIEQRPSGIGLREPAFALALYAATVLARRDESKPAAQPPPGPSITLREALLRDAVTLDRKAALIEKKEIEPFARALHGDLVKLIRSFAKQLAGYAEHPALAKPQEEHGKPSGQARVAQLEAALAWVFGEKPDAQGRWFDHKDFIPPLSRGSRVPMFWWRKPLREMVSGVNTMDSPSSVGLARIYGLVMNTPLPAEGPPAPAAPHEGEK